MKYSVYATVTAKIYLGDYEAKDRIDAARTAIHDKREQIKANLCADGLYAVEVSAYDSVEVDE